MSTWCQFAGGGEVRATAVQLRQSLNQLLALACLELVQVSGELIGRRKDRLIASWCVRVSKEKLNKRRKESSTRSVIKIH